MSHKALTYHLDRSSVFDSVSSNIPFANIDSSSLGVFLLAFRVPTCQTTTTLCLFFFPLLWNAFMKVFHLVLHNVSHFDGNVPSLCLLWGYQLWATNFVCLVGYKT